MQNHLFTKQRGKPGYSGFRGVLAAMLLGSLLFAAGARAAALSGTYTIDASGSGNYTSFKLAVADLTSYGISGSVTFNVTATTYSEVVSIGAITGTSATSTITFRGKGRGKTILSSAATTVTMKAYTIFDNMTIATTAGSYTVYANLSTGCSLTNDNINMVLNTSTNYAVYAYNSNNFTLYNCEVYGGYYGIELYGTTTSSSAAYGFARISHNRFVEQSYYGIYDYADFKDSIAFNVIDSSYGTTRGYGVYDYYACGLIFWGNKITCAAYYGAVLELQDDYQVSGQPTSSMDVNNWFVCPGGQSTNYAPLYDVPEYSNNYVCAFNTCINLAGSSYACLFEPYSATNWTFANNIIYNTVSSMSYFFELYAYSSSAKLMDGNCYYSSGYQVFYIYFGTTSTTQTGYANYASYVKGIGGFETHSTNVIPPFVSLTYPYDLHMSTTKAAANKGISGIGINIDIDGKGRFPTPTAGASESYYGVVNNNAGVTALISPYASCPGSATVTVTVADLGLNAISGSSTNTIAWTWNGVPQTSVNYTTSIPLYGQTNLTLGTVTLTAGVSYTLKAWPTYTNGFANPGGANDTLTVTGIMAALGSGTYTIDGTKSTGGTNFKTFSDAATALNAGVCGPIVFNVTAATYNEAVTLNTVPGASSTNTITFHGQGRAKTTLTNSGIPVSLKGSSYTIFDNMTISTTGTGNNINDAGSTGCGFTNDNLAATTSGTGYVINSASSIGLKVKNCRIVGGYYSLYITSNFDSFANNRIINSGYYTIYESSCHGNVYWHNVVDSIYNTSPYAGVY